MAFESNTCSIHTMTVKHYHPKWRNTASPQSGLSLIEILIAITISMIALIVMLNLFRNTENSRRITGTTADTQINVQVALASLERDAKNAGLGMANRTCQNVTYFDGTEKIIDSTHKRFPVVIENDASGNAQITLSGTTNGLSAFKSRPLVNGWLRDTTSTFDVENIAGFSQLCKPSGAAGTCSASTLVLIEQPKSCVLAKISSIDTATRTLSFTTGGGFSITESNFKTADYPVDGALISVIGGFESYQYQLKYDTGKPNTLTVQDKMGGNAAPQDVLLRNVIGFHAEYGIDNNGDGTIDSYAAPGTPIGDPTRIIAFRIALLVKGEHFDKEAFDSTQPVTQKLVWWEGKDSSSPKADPTKEGAYAVALTGEDQYYRYRVAESIIPIRNAIWSQ